MANKQEWIRQHRAEIDKVIRGQGCQGTLNDNDRAEWLANDEGLYNWARSEGVRV